MFSTKTVQAHNLFGTPVAPSAAAGCLPRPGVRSHRRYLVRSQNETDAVPKPQDAPANQAKVRCAAMYEQQVGLRVSGSKVPGLLLTLFLGYLRSHFAMTASRHS
eukprot:scaffold101159_cov22-Tisochrysis_lutea.AAC.5